MKRNNLFNFFRYPVQNFFVFNFFSAVTSEQTKLQFVRQLEQTLEGIRQTKLRVEKKYTEEKMKRDNIRENYQEMLDKQRLYYKTVKDFQEVKPKKVRKISRNKG